MTPDWQTNSVYFSDLLPKQYPIPFRAMKAVLEEEQIPFHLIANTNDIWARDYMPVQLGKNEFMQFIYAPDYLKDVPGLITTFDQIFEEQIGIKPSYSNIKIDGGNIVCNSKYAILTDKAFKENGIEKSKKNEFISDLEEVLQAEVIIIPEQPYDVIGHSDGMVRFIDDTTLLVNDYRNWESKSFQEKLSKAFANKGFTIISCPYYIVDKKNQDGIPYAHGCYINYLRVGDILFLPQFGNTKADKEALRFFKKNFEGKLYPINCQNLAQNGGVLNCVSWTIRL